MTVYTDNIKFAEIYLSDMVNFSESSLLDFIEETSLPPTEIFAGNDLYRTEINIDSIIKILILIENSPSSQFDMLIGATSSGNIPDGIFCMAGSGKKFHGLRNRPWESLMGNIHLSCYLKPNINTKMAGIGFSILPALSVISAIGSIPGLKGKAKIKWVNDILVGNGKVSGFITRSQVRGNIITGVVLGIGLNVEARPNVEPTPFVPGAACLRDFTSNPECNLKLVTGKLIDAIRLYYEVLISNGYGTLLKEYTERSGVIGRRVDIYSDPVQGSPEFVVSGIVSRIGENLELYLDGRKNPITKGRLVIANSKPAAHRTEYP